MVRSAESRGGQDVVATLTYAGEFEGRGRFDLEDPDTTNIAFEAHRVSVRDARPIRDGHSLETNGFIFARHRSMLAERRELFAACDRQTQKATGIQADYETEMCAFVREWTGADHVIPQMGSTISRTSKRAKQRSWAVPAAFVHLDYTPEAAELFVKWTAEVRGEDPPPHGRFMFIQTWRAISPGPQDSSLCVCDGSSVPPQDAIVVDTILGPPDVPGTRFPFRICKHRSSHEWFYLSDMEPDDVLLFKGYDSAVPLAMNAMHTAFDNPLAGPDAAPRRSLESRYLCFFA